MLIMGALFAVALLAFLAGLWLAYLEKQEMLAKGEGSEMVSVVGQKAVPAAEAELPQGGPRLLEEVKAQIDSERLREIVAELHALQEQAHGINERLLRLSDLVEEQLQQQEFLYAPERREMAV